MSSLNNHLFQSWLLHVTIGSINIESYYVMLHRQREKDNEKSITKAHGIIGGHGLSDNGAQETRLFFSHFQYLLKFYLWTLNWKKRSPLWFQRSQKLQWFTLFACAFRTTQTSKDIWIKVKAQFKNIHKEKESMAHAEELSKHFKNRALHSYMAFMAKK